jgi:hypothetical protein
MFQYLSPSAMPHDGPTGNAGHSLPFPQIRNLFFSSQSSQCPHWQFCIQITSTFCGHCSKHTKIFIDANTRRLFNCIISSHFCIASMKEKHAVSCCCFPIRSCVSYPFRKLQGRQKRKGSSVIKDSGSPRECDDIPFIRKAGILSVSFWMEIRSSVH